MGTTINSTTALIASKLASAPKTAEVKKNAETARPQHTEAYSSTFSNAARSMAMAGINFVQQAASAPAPQKADSVNYTEGINCTLVEKTDGDTTNEWWLDVMGYENPPYLPKSEVQIIELQEDTKFCRVYDGEVSGMLGGWVMKLSDVEGLTPEEIKDKFALPATPVKICDVTVPAGTKMRTGLCNPLEGWGKGGGVQFDLMGKRIDKNLYGNERDIQTG